MLRHICYIIQTYQSHLPKQSTSKKKVPSWILLPKSNPESMRSIYQNIGVVQDNSTKQLNGWNPTPVDTVDRQINHVNAVVCRASYFHKTTALYFSHQLWATWDSCRQSIDQYCLPWVSRELYSSSLAVSSNVSCRGRLGRWATNEATNNQPTLYLKAQDSSIPRK